MLKNIGIPFEINTTIFCGTEKRIFLECAIFDEVGYSLLLKFTGKEMSHKCNL